MERLTVKYNRFLELMGRFRRKMCVPTLDIDLAWHTAQLSPSTYFATVILKCYRFVNHDDKIESATLQGGFEWTSKAYQKRFGEVYSECTCWYCETLRSSHISSFGSSLGMSSQERSRFSFCVIPFSSGATRPSEKNEIDSFLLSSHITNMALFSLLSQSPTGSISLEQRASAHPTSQRTFQRTTRSGPRSRRRQKPGSTRSLVASS